MKNSIVIQDVHKKFGETAALGGVSFQVNSGELFGLIGPDGAGKTTLLRAVCTLLLPDQGHIQVAGLDTRKQAAQIRALLGYMPQRFSLYQDLTVEENLNFFFRLFQVPEEEREPRMAQMYRFSQLEPFRNRYAGALSGGMKQKLALSCALIHTPHVLVLDEPTFGVDPVSRQEFWDILRAIQKEGTTILVSTAYMDEADQCDRVGLFFNGEIAALDSPDGLKAAFPHPLFRIEGKELRRIRDFFAAQPEVQTTQLFGDALHVAFYQSPREEDWQRYQGSLSGALERWSPHPPSIEDVFLNLIGNKQDDPNHIR